MRGGLLADKNRLRVDEFEDVVGQILVGAHFLGEVLGVDGLVVVDVHGQVVVLDPLFRHALKLAGDGVLGDFDARHGHKGLALL